MNPKELAETLDEVQVLDVREEHEWEAGHIEQAHHIPMGELSARQGELAQDRRIVTVCRSGARSGQVASALQRAGYDAENLDGGMQEWDAEGLPFVGNNGDPYVA